MTGATFLVLIVGMAAGAALTTFAVRRRATRHVADLQWKIGAAQDSLAAERRSLADDREVRELVLASMDVGVLLIDGQGRRVFANEALARHLGTVPPDVDHLLPVDFRDAARRATGGEVIEVDAEAGSPVRWLRATARPAGDDGSVLLVVEDITEARRIDSIRRDFVANASHELKTPVASIRAAAETLADGAIDDPPSAHRFTDQLEREAMRLSRIVADLLDLSRLETGSDLHEHVHLSVVAKEEIHRHGDQIESAGVTVTLSSEGASVVQGAGRDLALLVRNLIDNAVRYTLPGGSVAVQIATDGDHVVMRVRDTGAGIPRRDLPRIFERFYRVDRARSRETGGTGLGLAIVKHVAENHGGSVEVESSLGDGTTFTVRLPRDAAATST